MSSPSVTPVAVFGRSVEKSSAHEGNAEPANVTKANAAANEDSVLYCDMGPRGTITASAVCLSDKCYLTHHVSGVFYAF